MDACNDTERDRESLQLAIMRIKINRSVVCAWDPSCKQLAH